MCNTTEQLAGYEQASRDRIAGIRADRAEREANADRATFVEERDVTDPEAHSRAATGRVHADPEQSRDEHAGPELGGGDSQQTQADELAAAGDVAAQVEIEGMSGWAPTAGRTSCTSPSGNLARPSERCSCCATSMTTRFGKRSMLRPTRARSTTAS